MMDIMEKQMALDILLLKRFRASLRNKGYKKVYFIHTGYGGILSADFFVRGIKPLKDGEEAERRYNVDYYIPDCQYVRAFLKGHHGYVYIGSSDNAHTIDYRTKGLSNLRNNWGMSFDGYKQVECPALDEEE
ncbi:MAG: hypothetical protein JRM72_06625 [Nitrososphaerota archaeon]|jgi:hypothetical protein|nr:hypothetical protein [Nitrososphaerota archaeon]